MSYQQLLSSDPKWGYAEVVKIDFRNTKNLKHYNQSIIPVARQSPSTCKFGTQKYPTLRELIGESKKREKMKNKEKKKRKNGKTLVKLIFVSLSEIFRKATKLCTWQSTNWGKNTTSNGYVFQCLTKSSLILGKSFKVTYQAN